MRYLTTISLFVLVAFTASSQDFDRDSIYYTPIEKKAHPHRPISSDKNSHYFFNFLSGTLIGGSGIYDSEIATFSFSTTHGVRLGKRFGVGAGVGFDSYSSWKALPFFGTLSYDLLGKKNRLFAQLNYGVSHVKKVKSQYEYGSTTHEGGTMISPSLGYKIVYGDLRLYISVGYKSQKIFLHSEYPAYYSYAFSIRAPGPNSSFNDTALSLNRAYFSIGFGWK
ncbi:MAG: hypothetical protein JJE09_04830 [Bacteroidia bacterium]|nr:hypothetical protein [Bacteroidia bacterium]